MFKKARPARPQPLGQAERTEEYVSTAKGRPACALARRSAAARRREAAPAKAGNAAGEPFGKTQGMLFQHRAKHERGNTPWVGHLLSYTG
jgi:hypothetical protein